MPTPTFFNLPAQKRERIMAAALAEFAGYSFRNVSIARIIDAAGIPRGSFYQYFEDLKDLYKYIMQCIGEVKYAYVMKALTGLQTADIFTTLKELYREGMQFAFDYPEYAAIGNLFFKEDYELKREIYGDQVERSGNFFEDLLRQGQASGELNPNIDVKIAAEVFFNLNIAFIDNYLASRKKGIFDGRDEFLESIEKMLYIVEYGLKKR